MNELLGYEKPSNALHWLKALVAVTDAAAPMRKAKYITTPIFYVNAKPHLGHAYTAVLADTLARWSRDTAYPNETFFTAGVDEHGEKVRRAAAAAERSPQDHCDLLAGTYEEVFRDLRISHDKFVRTTDAGHVALVQDALSRLYRAGFIRQQKFAGWYSAKKDLTLS